MLEPVVDSLTPSTWPEHTDLGSILSTLEWMKNWNLRVRVDYELNRTALLGAERCKVPCCSGYRTYISSAQLRRP